jgi:hypothetical protein
MDCPRCGNGEVFWVENYSTEVKYEVNPNFTMGSRYDDDWGDSYFDRLECDDCGAKWSSPEQLEAEVNGAINATFTSVWDGGFHIATSCKVDTKTREVFDIVSVDVC